MEHPREEILVDFIFDELDESEAREIRAHVEECDQCRERLSKLMATLSTLSEFKEVEPSGNVRKNMLERLEYEEVTAVSMLPYEELKIRALRRRPLLRIMAIAAAILFAFYLGQVYFPKAFTPKVSLLNARLEVPSVVSPDVSIPVHFAAWNEAADLPEDAPQKNMNINLLLKKPDGKIISWDKDQKTGSDGAFQKEISLPEKETGVYEVIVESGGKHLLKAPIEVRKTYDIDLMLNKPIYRPGEYISARIVARESTAGAAKGEDATLTFRDPLDSLVKQSVLKLDDYGVAVFNYVLADIVPLGEYTLKISIGQDEIERKIIVDDYTLPSFKVTLDAPQDFITTNNGFKGSVKAEYFFGKPIVQAFTNVEYYVLQNKSLMKIFSVNGYADDKGEFRIVMDSSVLSSQLGIIDSVTESYFRITVEDSANRREEIVKAYPLSNDVIVIKAFPGGGRIHPLVKNTIHVSTSDPTGNPVKCDMELNLSGKKTKAQTSELGVYSFEYYPEKQTVQLAVTAYPVGKKPILKTFALGIDETSYSFVIRTLKAIYKYGEEIELEIIVPFESRIDAHLDIYRGDHWVDSMDAPLEGTATKIKIPVEGAYGEITIEGSLMQGHRIFGRDKAKVIILPPDDLKVKVTTDKETYSDGQKIEARINVKSGNEPRRASLGIVVPDQSIVAAGEKSETASKLITGTILAALDEKLLNRPGILKDEEGDEFIQSAISEKETLSKDFSPKNALAFIMNPQMVKERSWHITSALNRWKIIMAFSLAVILYVSVLISIFLAIYNLRRGSIKHLPLAYNGIVTLKVFAVWGSMTALSFALSIAYPGIVMFIIGLLFSLGFLVSLMGCLRRIDILTDGGLLYHVLASTGIVISSLLLSHLWMVYPFLQISRGLNPLLNTMFIATLASIGCLMIVSMLFIPLKKGEAKQ